MHLSTWFNLWFRTITKDMLTKKQILFSFYETQKTQSPSPGFPGIYNGGSIQWGHPSSMRVMNTISTLVKTGMKNIYEGIREFMVLLACNSQQIDLFLIIL